MQEVKVEELLKAALVMLPRLEKLRQNTGLQDVLMESVITLIVTGASSKSPGPLGETAEVLNALTVANPEAAVELSCAKAAAEAVLAETMKEIAYDVPEYLVGPALKLFGKACELVYVSNHSECVHTFRTTKD